jgi:quinol monooxygenase YgiN
MKKIIWILALIIGSFFTGCESKNDPVNNLIVIVKYKKMTNKSVDAVTGLKKLIEEVKKENHFVTIRLHIDQKDNSNILLYEEWDDELYYKNQHMKTEHLKEFIVESQTFLAGPPEITFWKVNAVYK